MKLKQNSRPSALSRTIIAMLVTLSLCGQLFAQTVAPARAALATEERELASRIDVQTIKDATATLSAPDMEGRGTMQPGGDKAANWIADRFKALGMKPLGDKDSYLQKIEFKETTFAPETTFKIGDEALKIGTDYGFFPYSSEEKSASGELVFVAYGLQAKAIGRDDLAGVNVAGKIVVMLDGPPANISESDWKGADAKWKILGGIVAAGAAGIVIIPHGREKESNETLIDYFSRRQISLAGEKGDSLPIPPVVGMSKTGAEKLFTASGVTLAAALAQAESTGFKPIKLNKSAKIASKYKRVKGYSNNVVGYFEGSDPKLKEEAVLFSAHYDAYGVENGKIYNGAADNALGTAEMLAVAEAFSKSPVKPKRSLIFLAVTAEEYGLYGSKYWAKNPTWNIKKVSANLNLDGVGTEVYGPVKTMVGYGAEHSTLGAMLADVSAAMEITVAPDPVPDENVFYRSDHYSFVERGVPALMLMGAPAGDIQDAMKRMKEWEKTDYHQPGDVIQKTWAWEGAKSVADVMGIMGLRLANGDTMPSWLKGGRFEKLERGNTKDLPKEK